MVLKSRTSRRVANLSPFSFSIRCTGRVACALCFGFICGTHKILRMLILPAGLYDNETNIFDREYLTEIEFRKLFGGDADALEVG